MTLLSIDWWLVADIVLGIWIAGALAIVIKRVAGVETKKGP
jgi:beta-lactamase regulating signal transducer with metallopeptidase domain